MKSKLSRHTVLDILKRLIEFSCNIWPLKKSRHYVLSKLMCYVLVQLVIEELMKQTHSVRYSRNIDTVLLHYLTSEKGRKYVLANLMCESWVLLVFVRWFKQTHCVRYNTKIDLVMLHYFTSTKKQTHYVLDNLLC